MAKRGQTTI